MPTLRYLGHSAAEVIDGDTRVLIDPFLTGNSLAAAQADELEPRAILISHGHNDHVGDAIEIAKRSEALCVGTFELATWLESKGVSAHGMHVGGAHQFDWGWVKLTLAFHGSTYVEQDGTFVPFGQPAGVLFRTGGSTLYHAGDTALFGDMALIARHGIDLALLPIGDNFTMGPEDALEAVRLLKPKVVVPIHYDTFPVIRQDARAWAEQVTAQTGVRAVALQPGETIDY
ncbi:MAG: metal-dependent hydrolase [Armatimonadota bacterium]